MDAKKRSSEYVKLKNLERKIFAHENNSKDSIQEIVKSIFNIESSLKYKSINRIVHASRYNKVLQNYCLDAIEQELYTHGSNCDAVTLFLLPINLRIVNENEEREDTQTYNIKPFITKNCVTEIETILQKNIEPEIHIQCYNALIPKDIIDGHKGFEVLDKIGQSLHEGIQNNLPPKNQLESIIKTIYLDEKFSEIVISPNGPTQTFYLLVTTKLEKIGIKNNENPHATNKAIKNLDQKIIDAIGNVIEEMYIVAMNIHNKNIKPYVVTKNLIQQEAIIDSNFIDEIYLQFRILSNTYGMVNNVNISTKDINNYLGKIEVEFIFKEQDFTYKMGAVIEKNFNIKIRNLVKNQLLNYEDRLQIRLKEL